MSATETLIAAAQALGFAVVPSDTEGCKDWYDTDDEFVGTFDAHDGWAYVHELRAIARAEDSHV